MKTLFSLAGIVLAVFFAVGTLILHNNDALIGVFSAGTEDLAVALSGLILAVVFVAVVSTVVSSWFETDRRG